MEKASNIVVKILATVLLTAAVLKSWQLFTEPAYKAENQLTKRIL